MRSLRRIGVPVDLSLHAWTMIGMIGRRMRTIVVMSVGISAIYHKVKRVVVPCYRTIEVTDRQILVVLIGCKDVTQLGVAVRPVGAIEITA